MYKRQAQDLPQEAAARLQQVTESVALNEEGSQVRFTLPELEEGEDWRVQISGRYVAADQVSMSCLLYTSSCASAAAASCASKASEIWNR